MSDLLRRVSRVALRYTRVREERIEAVREAARVHSQAAVAEAAGVSQQAISALLKRDRRHEQ